MFNLSQTQILKPEFSSKDRKATEQLFQTQLPTRGVKRQK